MLRDVVPPRFDFGGGGGSGGVLRWFGWRGGGGLHAGADDGEVPLYVVLVRRERGGACKALLCDGQLAAFHRHYAKVVESLHVVGF